MVWLLHFTKPKRVFGLLFPYQWKFRELPDSSTPKKKLVFFPPLDSKRSLFKVMLSNANLKNICNRLDSHGVMLMKTYFLGN